MDLKRITIIGLGLMGGSLAKALKTRVPVREIFAVDCSLEPINQAIAEGVIDKGFHSMESPVLESDIIFICTPIKKTFEYINQMEGKVNKNCIITDIGSTKDDIIKYINKMLNPPVFIGGHPMTGTEKTGYSFSVAHLFENAYYILTPSKTTTPESIRLMTYIIHAIGAIPITLESDHHDAIVGTISHVPHIIASALVHLVKDSDRSEGLMKLLAAGGFKDITRIASSGAEMWENIVLSNKDEIKGILQSFLQIIQKFGHFLDQEESGKVYEFFKNAKHYRDSFPCTRKGTIPPLFEIAVDVMDKPGILGKIATLLGNNHINIKNMNISNSREGEQGCLRITLPCNDSMDKAYYLLNIEGYKVHKVL
ncbi:MAG: prephenate dehydrogenase [Candidatus Brocadiae bacterium]|nr:prephenate dehydrogenase [Candidatus Brocadiia bacterium]